MKNSALLHAFGLTGFMLASAGCTPTNTSASMDPTVFAKAPPRPPDYDIATKPNDFAGLSHVKGPDSMPVSISTPEPPVTDPKQRLQTLDVLSVGLSVEMLRQGDVWKEVQKAADFHSSVLPPPESDRYRYSDDPGVYEKRLADVLELALKPMVEAWPVPAVTAYDVPKREMSQRLKDIFWSAVDNLRMPAGLHWSQIKQLDVVYSDTPEDVVEAVFRTFERYPDLPALLVYVEGPSGQYADGQRVRNAPVATNAAMVVARRERVEWLRPWAPYTKINFDEWWTQFNGWEKTPPKPFKPTPFFPTPWTRAHFKQWDSLPTLAQLHRPVVAKLTDDHGAPLKRKEQEAALVAGWQTATQTAAPARVFFDAGTPGTGIGTLAPVLHASASELDLIDPQECIDLAARLGDTGAASPFVQLVLATMATAESGTPSAVVPLRRADQATFMLLTPARKPAEDAFDVKLLPQTSEEPDQPQEDLTIHLPEQASHVYVDAERVAADQQALDAWLNAPPGPSGAGQGSGKSVQ